MPFGKGVSGNPKGRPSGENLVNPKSVADGANLKQKEFQDILNRLKPLNKKAIKKLHQLLDSDTTSETGQLRAVALVLKTYEDLMKELYKDTTKTKDSDEDGNEALKPIPFSLNRVPQSDLKN